MCWMTLAKGCDALAENCVVLKTGALPTFLARMTTLSGFLAATTAATPDLSAGCCPTASPGA